MQDKIITNYKNHPFFERKESIPLTIDNSYLEFEIPNAEELYYGLIHQNSYPLISKLSIKDIEDYLIDLSCNLDLLEDEYSSFQLPDLRNYYNFSFKPNNTNFKEREQLINALYQLRYAKEGLGNDELFLDKNEPIQLHLSSKIAYTFATPEKKSDIPVSYRATCLYDLIVRELYGNYLNLNKDSAYLISDYLSIHTNEFAFLDKDENEYLVRDVLITCIQDIVGDKNITTLMEEASRQAQSEESFKRGIFSTIPLSPSAILHTNPEKQKRREKLNQYSHHYCALIQYRYLVDLKSIFEKSDWLEREKSVVEEQMIKWENFRTQPLIVASEKIIEKISELSTKAGKSISLSWEEGHMPLYGDGFNIVYLHLIPTYCSNTLDRNNSISIAKSFSLDHGFFLGRANYHQANESDYANGYLFFIRKDFLAKFNQQLTNTKIIPSKKRTIEEPVRNEENHHQLRKIIANISNLASKEETLPAPLNALREQAEELKSELTREELDIEVQPRFYG